MTDTTKIIPLILAGGQGSRLWDTYTPDLPKQFMPLKTSDTTYENALARVKNKNIFASSITICAEENLAIVDQLLNDQDVRLICEPVGRHTAPACCIGALAVEEYVGPNQLMLILPADHYIEDIKAFEEAVGRGRQYAENGQIVPFGIRPEFGHTEYGYIEMGEAVSSDIFAVSSFIEKPRIRAAHSYFKGGKHLWNSGIFLARSDVLLNEIKQHQSDILLYAQYAWEKSNANGRCRCLEQASFDKSPRISFDHAVMEQTQQAVVVECHFKWQDLGGWDALMEFATELPA